MIEIKVPDMTCGHCVSAVTKAVKALDAAAAVDVSLAEHCVRVQTSASREDLVHALSGAGYPPLAA